MSVPRKLRIEHLPENASVSRLELFFDLVFVFALTRVTDLLSADTSVKSLVQAVLVVALLWWVWVGYSWMGNLARADEGVMPLFLLAAMGATFIISITIPEAFEDMPGGLPGPVVFAIAYFTVRALHWGQYWLLSVHDTQLRRQLLRWLPSIVISTCILLVASQTSGTTQLLLWVAALTSDYVGTLIAGEGWRLRSVSHFAERHGLIIIVALGESIVSIGIGVANLPVSWPIIVASLLGLVTSGLLWWAYFDVTSLSVEYELAHARGVHRVRIARNCYTYGHLPMVIGIVMVSLGLKKVLSYVAGESDHTLTDPLYGVPLACLLGGTALYLAALTYFQYYANRWLTTARLISAVLLVAIYPLAAHLPALASLGIVTAVLAALITWETRHFDLDRDRIRHNGE